MLKGLKAILPKLSPLHDAKRVLVEIGTVREHLPGQGSTRLLAEFAMQNNLHFVTVDMDPFNTYRAQDMFDRLGMPFQAINMKGEDYLHQHQGRLDFVYLDAYDVDHGHHSELRQSRYIKMLGAPITDEGCHQMHLECAEAIVEKLSDEGLIGFDDTWVRDGKWVGKGATAIPYFLSHGLVMDSSHRSAALFKRKQSWMQRILSMLPT
jgi:hypothetical protein